MGTRRLFPLVLLACLAGCTHAAPPAAPTIDVSKFDALQHAASSIPHATGPNATHAQLAGGVKGFATEMTLLKTQPLNSAEQPVLAAYREALDAYQFSLDLLAEQERRQASAAGGDRVPVQIGTMNLTSLIDGATRYSLPLLDETLPGGVALKVLPSDAPRQVWIAGDAALARAASRLTSPATAP